MLRAVVRLLKKLPIDLGQYECRYTTKGKQIAFSLIDAGAGKKALDVGCRDGYWSEKLKSRGYEVVSCDLEPHYPGAVTLNANQRLPFADNTFDVVWCSEVIEHLIDPYFTVAEFKRILRPGGSLVMTTPNQGFWLFQAIEKLGIRMAAIQNEDHHQFLTYDDMRRIVGEQEAYGYFPYVLLKARIRRFARSLSPTIVLRHRNDKKPAISTASPAEKHATR